MRGHVRKTPNGRWIARYPLGGRGGKYRSRTKDRKVDAERWLVAQNAADDRGEWLDPKSGEETFGPVAEDWLRDRARSVAATTWPRDDSVMRNQVLPAFAGVQLKHISPDSINDWIESLEAQGFSPATIRKAHQLLAMVLDQAKLARKIPDNPARIRGAIHLPTVDSREMRFLDADEIQTLADAIDPHYRALVLTAAYTGLRWGELSGLRRRNLDLEIATIRVEESLAEVGGEHIRKDPKSRASKRTVALSAGVVDVLRGHLEEHPVIGDGAVFTGPDGGLLRRSAFRSRIWLPAVRKSVGEPLRFHDLRHSHVAMLIAAGVHPAAIKSRLGHASITVTLDTYAHLFEGIDQAAADALDGVMAQAGTRSGSTEQLATVSGVDQAKA